MKVLINSCHGGFSLSKAVYDEMGISWDGFGYLFNWEDAGRSDPKLIAAVEKIGVDKSSGRSAKLKIVEIPDGVDFEIDEYGGMESIHEKHRSWD